MAAPVRIFSRPSAAGRLTGQHPAAAAAGGGETDRGWARGVGAGGWGRGGGIQGAESGDGSESVSVHRAAWRDAGLRWREREGQRQRERIGEAACEGAGRAPVESGV